ncbi:MAG: MerR family transcriptional regulator [Rikenellaceae bacterium]|nr:MerR family transcriptional regulator [Rikenellaceae bacterium]
MKQTGNQSQKIYYTMGEVAEMLDVSQSLLRFWEKEFAEIRPKRNKKGNRLFTEQDVKTLKVIYHLVKERGLKIAAAKRQLKLGEQPVSREAAIVEKLHSIRAILMEVKLALDNDTATYQSEEPMDAEPLVEVESVAEEVVEVEQMVEVAEGEIASENSEAEEVVQAPEAQAEEGEKAEKPKKKAARKPRRPKFAFKEVELFSLDELDAMQPKPGERRGNGEVQQMLFAEE